MRRRSGGGERRCRGGVVGEGIDGFVGAFLMGVCVIEWEDTVMVLWLVSCDKVRLNPSNVLSSYIGVVGVILEVDG